MFNLLANLSLSLKSELDYFHFIKHCFKYSFPNPTNLVLSPNASNVLNICILCLIQILSIAEVILGLFPLFQ